MTDTELLEHILDRGWFMAKHHNSDGDVDGYLCLGMGEDAEEVSPQCIYVAGEALTPRQAVEDAVNHAADEFLESLEDYNARRLFGYSKVERIHRVQ